MSELYIFFPLGDAYLFLSRSQNVGELMCIVHGKLTADLFNFK